MSICAKKVHSFFVRCLYMFLLDGTMKAYGVILEATVESYQVGHALIGPIFTLQTSVSYLIAPLVRLLGDSFNHRMVAILGGILATAGFIGRAVLPVSSVWYLLMFLSVSGVGFGLVNYVSVICLKNSFRGEYPSAYTLSSFSSYFGVAALPPVLGYLMRNYGEKVGVFAFGLLTSSLIATGIFTSSGTDALDAADERSRKGAVEGEDCHEMERPMDETEDYDDETEDSEDEAGLVRACSSSANYWGSLLTHHPAFICLILISILRSYEYISWSIYLVPYGENIGLNSTRAVYLSTAGGISGIFGKLFGLAIFRWGSRVTPLGVTMPTVMLSTSYGVSLLFEEFGVLLSVASLSGFSLSLMSCVCSAWLPNTVCARHFEGAVAVMYFTSGIATLLGGLVTGALVDITGYYRPAFVMLSVLSLFGTVVSSIWWLFFDEHRKRKRNDPAAVVYAMHTEMRLKLSKLARLNSTQASSDRDVDGAF